MCRKMAKLERILELLRTLIMSTANSKLKINEAFLSEIQTCLKNAQEKIDFLQLESQLQQEELHQNRHHSEPVFVQNIETTTHQQHVNNVTVHSNKAAVVYADAETQSALPKPIIRPWEQLVHNKHRTGLGYDKDLSFHIPDYAKPIQFQSAGFIYDSSPAPHDSSTSAVPLLQQQQQQQIVKC